MAAESIGVTPEYIFVADPRDTDTTSVAEEFCGELDRQLYFAWIEERPDTPIHRHWNDERFHRMVYLRNHLLGAVRQIAPRLFLSLDSDILLHAESIQLMLEGLSEFHAIGSKTYMTPDGKDFPSYAMLDHGTFSRRDSDSGVFPADVIMAIKLMTPAAYNIDYEWSKHGEDIGWSVACRAAGLRLGWDGRVTSKHVMDESLLDRIDERCGF
jgi:hypothetical protein